MTRREHKKQKEVVYFEKKTYELVRQHFSLFPTNFQVNFHELKTCLRAQVYDSNASHADFFDNLVKLAKFMSEFVISFHNMNFSLTYTFLEDKNELFELNPEFAFNAAFDYYKEFYFRLAPCEEKLHAIDQYITLLYYQYKMYSLLDADQFKDRIEECLSGLSQFVAVENEMRFVLRSQVDQSINLPSYGTYCFFTPSLTSGSPKEIIWHLGCQEKLYIQVRDFEKALSVAKSIDELLVANAQQDSREMVLAQLT